MTQMRPKLLICVPSLEGGGIEKVTYVLAQGLSDEFDILVFPQAIVKGDDPLLAGRLSENVTVLPAPLGSEALKHLHVPKQVSRLVQVLRTERPNVLLTTYPRVHLVAGIALRLIVRSERPKWLIAEHGDPRRYLGSHATRAAVKRFLLRWATGCAEGRLAVSNIVAQIAKEVYRGGAFETVYNPVITPEFRRMADEPVNHPWFDGTIPVVLAAARLEAVKGVDVLLRAFVGVLREIPQARLVILGDGGLRKPLESLAEEIGIGDRVWFAGFRPNPLSYMSRAAVFVLPSYSEGQPLAAIEAMSVGTPVVASDLEAIREFASEDEVVFVAPGDVEALATAIVGLVRNPERRRQMACRARDRAASLFGAQAAVKRYKEVLWATLHGGRESEG